MNRRPGKWLGAFVIGCSILLVLGSCALEKKERWIEPDQFQLLDVSNGKPTALGAVSGPRATVIFFVRNECPVSWEYEHDLARKFDEWTDQGIHVVAVNSNYGDTIDAINAHRLSEKLPYPVYQDIDGRLADKLGAARASEVTLLEPQGRVLYQGRIDDRVTVAFQRASPTTSELSDAISATLQGHKIAATRTEAPGCFISRPRERTDAAGTTYAEHIAPIMQKYCVRCHSPGQAGPMSLTTYEQVAAWSRTIVEVLEENRMPPSRLAPPDPRYGDFVQEPEPSAEEIAAIAKWIDAGTPRGSARKPAASEAADRVGEWRIGEPDMIVKMPAPYRVPASGVVAYQYYELLNYTGEEKWVDAIEIKPGVRSVVHHANVYMAQPELRTIGFQFGERWGLVRAGPPAGNLSRARRAPPSHRRKAHAGSALHAGRRSP
jgi:peroxiredoxin